jgi:hypothetical protein
MRKYAVVTNNVVSSVVEIEEDQFNQYRDMLIDIQDLAPQPTVGWVLNGNKLEFPQNLSQLEELEYILADKKTEFGIKLARVAIVKIGVRNKILQKNGAQVAAVVNALLPVKLLLDTGALGTARYSCVGLKTTYTELSDIFDYVIAEINAFESANGL